MIQSFACDSIDVMPAFATLQADELTAAKMKAVAGDEEWKNDFKALFSKYQEGSLDEDGALDVIFRFTPVDLDDIYFGVDLELVDTILNDNFLLRSFTGCLLGFFTVKLRVTEVMVVNTVSNISVSVENSNFTSSPNPRLQPGKAMPATKSKTTSTP